MLIVRYLIKDIVMAVSRELVPPGGTSLDANCGGHLLLFVLELLSEVICLTLQSLRLALVHGAAHA